MMEANVDPEETSNIVSDSEDDHEIDVSMHHKVPLVLQNLDWDEITDIIRDMDLGPKDEQQRKEVRELKQLLLDIRYQLKNDNIILRAFYKGQGFHAFQAKDFHRKASIYMKKMGVYSLIQRLNGPYSELFTQACLANIVDRVETTLDDFYHSKLINSVQHTTMDSERAQVHLNYLYFVPETKQNRISLRPILVCNNGPTMHISHYLSELLWSILDQITHCQKFSHDANVVQALELYSQRHLLHPTTLFVTFSLDDISVVFRHEETLQALEHFLHTYAFANADFERENISIETIMQLVRLVLENQYFVYNNNLYRQLAGGASGSPLTRVLAYIYLYHCKPTLINALMANTQEIFGRHLDEAFLTWNGSEYDLRRFFDLSSHNHYLHPSIQRIKISVGTSVHFMDARLSHHNGILHTKVYHYQNVNQNNTLTQIPTMPLSLDEKSVRKALIRAVCYCSNVNNFYHEQNQIRSTHMLYGLSEAIFEQNVQQFLAEFGASTMSFTIADSDQYRYLRQCVIDDQRQQIELKKQRKHQEKNRFNFFYAEDLDTTEVVAMRQALDIVHKEFCQDHPEWTDIKFKLVPHRATPLSYNDYLVEKRPPLRLLTLSKSNIDDDSEDDDDDDSNDLQEN